MDTPTEINSVYWDRKKKSWEYELVPVEEYHGVIDCQYCNRPMSHNIKTGGEFKVVYVKCVVLVTINNYLILIIPLDTKYSIPLTKDSSSIVPSAHHPALFLIQDGIFS